MLMCVCVYVFVDTFKFEMRISKIEKVLLFVVVLVFSKKYKWWTVFGNAVQGYSGGAFTQTIIWELNLFLH